MPTVPAAFPFVEVRIDTSALQPIAQRAPGVVAVVGVTPNGANGGSATVNTPFAVDALDTAAALFSKVTDGVAASTPLYDSLVLALLQDPKPSKVYGVRAANADGYAAALSSLEAADDVTFVSLANEPAVGAAAAGNTPAKGQLALKAHVENMSAGGQKRIGFAMVDPAEAKSPTYAADVATAYDDVKSDTSRMVLIAARGAKTDAATAAMAAIAGYEPHISAVLKPVRGVKMPTEEQYAPGEIRALSEAQIVPLIEPSLIVGEVLRFAEGRCFTGDASQLYIDIVRTLDDLDYRLKAGLVGSVGDARITKAGMTLVKMRTDGILEPLKRRAVIANYVIQIPVLDVLNVPESSWTEGDKALVAEARANRSVDMLVTVTYGPAVHRLRVTLAPKF